MALRQEQIAFALVLGFLGLLAYFYGSSEVADGRRFRNTIELEHFQAPEVAVALPDSPAGTPLLVGERDLFSPPRDTRPLPPLALVPPPRAPMPGLRPPPEPGPAVRHWGQHLRVGIEPLDVPELFVDTDEDGVIEFAEVLMEEPGEARNTLEQQLRELGYLPPEDRVVDDTLTPEEIAAIIESYKKLYDWIEPSEVSRIRWGRVINRDRYGLNTLARLEEPLSFIELDPETGLPVSSIESAVPYSRNLVRSWGFADTASNRIEIFSRELEEVGRHNYAEVMAFADGCVRARHDAPRALAVAEELYLQLSEFEPGDPLPRLGLVRCLEAGFQFERAFAEYGRLENDFPLRPEVYARRAQLETRFLLWEDAEADYLTALKKERGSWEARWGYGRFLLARGREAEAVEHLEVAAHNAPDALEQKSIRVAIRTDLGRALLRAGRLEEALGLFRQALSADATDQRALAGLISTVLLEPSLAEGLDPEDLPGWVDDPLALEAAPIDGLGFELLLASGLWSLEHGPYVLALARLLDAAAADPLRSQLAWRAISHLAEVTDYPEEAWRFVEQALDAAPDDPWCLYQYGRLLARRDEHEDAAAAFQAALEIDLDFVDALVAMGELDFELGRHEDAERYLERAAVLDPEWAALWTLRGLNLLELEKVAEAREALMTARRLEPDDPTTLNALAWCVYRLGDSEEARVQLGILDDSRRDHPEDDPHRVWAREQIERIAEHASKEVWSDTFTRSSLLNEWEVDEGAGPLVSLVDGEVKLEGIFEESGEVRVYQTLNAALFVALEADVYVSADSAVSTGLFVARERRAGRDWETQGAVLVGRHRDGDLQYAIVRRGTPDEPVDVDWIDDFQPDRWVRLRIELVGDSADPRVTISVNGTPVAERVEIPDLGHSQTPLKIGLFVRGDTARTARVLMDNVEIVRRVPRR